MVERYRFIAFVATPPPLKGVQQHQEGRATEVPHELRVELERLERSIAKEIETKKARQHSSLLLLSTGGHDGWLWYPSSALLVVK